MRELLKRPLLLLFLAVIGAGLFKYGRTIKDYAVHGLPVGASAAAKLACSFYFVTGRSPEQIKAHDLRPLDPVLGLFNLEFDDKSQTVTASAFGLVSKTAQHRPNFGCTLVPGVQKLALLRSEREYIAPAAFDLVEPSAALRLAVEREFDSPDTRAVIVLQKGKLAIEKYAEGFSAQSKLLSWSVAKSITATAVGMLVQRELLTWEQDRLFPEWEGDARAQIRLIDLMHMSSGLDFDETYGPGSDVTHMLFMEPDMGAFVASSALAAEPGTRFNYSSGTTVLLMRLIKQVLGSEEAYVRFISQDVLNALGMADSLFEADASGVLVGSSYLFGTARDFARFGQFTLKIAQGQRSPLLPEDWYQLISTPAAAVEEGKYAAQFWLNTAGTRFEGVPQDALMALGHNGQVVAILPSQNAVLVRLAWSTDGTFKPEHFVERLLGALSL